MNTESNTNTNAKSSKANATRGKRAAASNAAGRGAAATVAAPAGASAAAATGAALAAAAAATGSETFLRVLKLLDQRSLEAASQARAGQAAPELAEKGFSTSSPQPQGQHQ